MNCQSSLSDAGSSKSNSGCATGRTRVCVAAFQNQPPMWLSTASVIEPLAADLLHEDLVRHLALAEARDLHALGEVGCRVLDRVVHVVRRHLHRHPDAVFREFFDLGLHSAIQADPLQPRSRSLGPCASSC